MNAQHAQQAATGHPPQPTQAKNQHLSSNIPDSCPRAEASTDTGQGSPPQPPGLHASEGGGPQPPPPPLPWQPVTAAGASSPNDSPNGSSQHTFHAQQLQQAASDTSPTTPASTAAAGVESATSEQQYARQIQTEHQDAPTIQAPESVEGTHKAAACNAPEDSHEVTKSTAYKALTAADLPHQHPPLSHSPTPPPAEPITFTAQQPLLPAGERERPAAARGENGGTTRGGALSPYHPQQLRTRAPRSARRSPPNKVGRKRGRTPNSAALQMQPPVLLPTTVKLPPIRHAWMSAASGPAGYSADVIPVQNSRTLGPTVSSDPGGATGAVAEGYSRCGLALHRAPHMPSHKRACITPRRCVQV